MHVQRGLDTALCTFNLPRCTFHAIRTVTGGNKADRKSFVDGLPFIFLVDCLLLNHFFEHLSAVSNKLKNSLEMPKDWVAQKENLKKFYITEDRPLEEVREILKDRYGFDASIRSYRMKIDEWNLRKYKSKNDISNRGNFAQPRTNLRGRIASPATSSLQPTSQRDLTRSTLSVDDLLKPWTADEIPAMHNPLPRNQHHSTEQGTVLAENSGAFEELLRLPTQTNTQSLLRVPSSSGKRSNSKNNGENSGFYHGTKPFNVKSPAPYHFNCMVKAWRNGRGVRDYVTNVLSVSGFEVATFQTMTVAKVNLFDLICDKVDKPEQVPLIKDLLRELSDSDLYDPTAQYICWRSAYIESHWTRFKRALGLLNLNGCMSREAADLVFRATFLLVGERLIDAYRARFDMIDSLGSAISSSTFKHNQRYLESPEYFRDREQYAAMLKDFRVRCVNHWEK
ncbi:hypothetical protein DL98DRAFT_510891 [Cadophora sp. DSE1049]|nr:hypothetical protein DL98DRAFT_510891 [Cadophora sp. DSE1049]